MQTPPRQRTPRDRQPERQCIGCGRRGAQAGFLRLSLDRGLEPPRVRVVMPGGKHAGRGAYLCRRRSCLDRALHRKAFQRAFRAPVVPDIDEIMAALAAACPTATEANNTAGG
ncbi:MAG: YlxR family protein [Thermoleophilia bacterium]|jgi:predicted RNA-binding protein YlxR (DUF448 family)